MYSELCFSYLMRHVAPMHSSGAQCFYFAPHMALLSYSRKSCPVLLSHPVLPCGLDYASIIAQVVRIIWNSNNDQHPLRARSCRRDTDLMSEGLGLLLV